MIQPIRLLEATFQGITRSCAEGRKIRTCCTVVQTRSSNEEGRPIFCDAKRAHENLAALANQCESQSTRQTVNVNLGHNDCSDTWKHCRARHRSPVVRSMRQASSVISSRIAMLSDTSLTHLSATGNPSPKTISLTDDRYTPCFAADRQSSYCISINI